MTEHYRTGQLILLGNKKNALVEGGRHLPAIVYFVEHSDGFISVPNGSVAMYLQCDMEGPYNVHRILFDEAVMLVNGDTILGPLEE